MLKRPKADEVPLLLRDRLRLPASEGAEIRLGRIVALS